MAQPSIMFLNAPGTTDPLSYAKAEGHVLPLAALNDATCAVPGVFGMLTTGTLDRAVQSCTGNPQVCRSARDVFRN